MKRDDTSFTCPECGHDEVRPTLDPEGETWLRCDRCGCRFPPEGEEEEAEDEV